MIALKITDIGLFFNNMLKGNIFDNFLLREASITTSSTFEIDGTIPADFYSDEDLEELNLAGLKYMPFSQQKNIVFQIMKGNRKPLYFKFVFMLSPANKESTIRSISQSFNTDDVTGMFINIIYKNETLTATSGISYRTFILDKSIEKEWDRFVTIFLKNYGVEEL